MHCVCVLRGYVSLDGVTSFYFVRVLGGSFNSLDTVEMFRSHSKDDKREQEQQQQWIQESKREPERESVQDNKLQIAFERTKDVKREIVDTPRFETQKIKRKREQPIAKRRKTPTPKTFYKILKGNQNVW